ncbi:MAG: DUF2202 domain-containing protein [Actinomycetia bacterium]|nr:DUF2202 domain-containing protein [Actinomycetes bacterium]
MKRQWKPVLVGAVAALLVLTVGGVALAGGSRWKEESGIEPSATRAVCSVSEPGTAAAVPLSETESEALLFMREEEKLARDVYTALYDRWGVSVFANIATSESRHMTSVKTLLDHYGLTDPVAVDTPGVFAEPDLQALYTQLVAQGTQSLNEALQVGVTIETLDIEDLEALLAASNHADISRVAENLLSGSENHLAAFTRHLAE